VRLNYGLRWWARKRIRSLKPRIDPRTITIIQSSDAVACAGMLRQSARTCEAYCRRHGYAYRSYVGVRRGYHSWQAIFNRVFQLRDLWEEGFRGWAFHIDADAAIVDLGFDLRWLIPLRASALIACHSGTTPNRWDINSGVLLLNLGSPDGRIIMERWHASVMSISEEELRQVEKWVGGPIKGDQARLHEILAQDAALTRRALHLAPAPILQDGVFVKHYLRASGLSLAEREEALRRQADSLLGTER
jgi:hypothetical protein